MSRTSNVLSTYTENSITLTVNLRTANDCVDDEFFTDDEGYFCVNQRGEDCSRFIIDWHQTVAWQDATISHCPNSCDVCDLPDQSVFTLTNSDGNPVSYKAGTTARDDGASFYGPLLSDPPEDVTSLNLVVPFPGCYTSTFISDPLLRYAPLLAYELSVDDPVVVLIPFPETGSWSFSPRGPTTFCLGNCALPLVYFPSSSPSCRSCLPGLFVDPDTMSCVPCPVSTYYVAPQDAHDLDQARQVCHPCPEDRPFSPAGSKGVDNCLDTRFLTHLFTASTDLDSIVEYSPPAVGGFSSFVPFVVEDEHLSEPRALAFLTPRLLVVANYLGSVDLYDAETASFLGTLIECMFPTGFVFLPASADGPDSPKLLVLSYQYEDGIARVAIFDVAKLVDFDGVYELEEGELLTPEIVVPVSFDELDDYHTIDRGFVSMSAGIRTGEVILANWLGLVVNFCVSPTLLGCVSSSSRILVQDLTGLKADAEDAGDEYGSRVFGQAQDFLTGAYQMRAGGRDRLLVLNHARRGADGGVYECGPPAGSNFGKDICRLVSAATTTPGGAEVFADAGLLLVTDEKGSRVLLLNLDSFVISAEVGDKRGALANPNSVASRPGFYAPSSSFNIQGASMREGGGHYTIVAGEELELALSLKGVGGKELPSGFASSGRGNFDASSLKIIAELVSGETEEAVVVNVVGDVAVGMSSEVLASIVLKRVGTWTVRLQENSLNKMDFGGSPFVIQVVSKATDPTVCQYDGPSSIVFLDAEYHISILLFDSYGNPTDHPSDEVEIGWEGGSVSDADRSKGSFDFKVTAKQPNAKQKILPLHVSLNGEPIKGSPFFIMVLGTPPSHITQIIMAIVIPVSVLLMIAVWRIIRTRQKLRQTVAVSKELEGKVGDLQDSLKASKYSADELEVMKVEMAALGTDRGNELRGVMIRYEDVEVLSMLGKGGFGVVHLAVYKNTKVAVKQLLDITPDSVKRFRFECFLMKNLRHPNLVALVGVVWDDFMLGCVLEYVENGSLEDHLAKDEKRPVDKKMTWRKEMLRFATEAALGVEYLHCTRYYDEGSGTWKDCIVHRDLKPDNMLVTSDWRLKLTDFGEARAVELNLTMTQVGTPIYMAPEILKNDRYNHKVDSYSFGVILAAMLRKNGNIINFFFVALQKDLKKADMTGLGLNVLNYKMHELGWRPHIPSSVYPSLRKLIKDLWQNDPAKRPDFREVVKLLTEDVSKEVSFLEEPEWDDELSSGSEEEVEEDDHVHPLLTVNLATQMVTQRVAVEQSKILAELRARGIVSDEIIAEITREIGEKAKNAKEEKKSIHKKRLSDLEKKREEKKAAKGGKQLKRSSVDQGMQKDNQNS